jgi:hypothetical protein
LSEVVVNPLVVEAVANGAAAQTRWAAGKADKETAHPIYRECIRVAHLLAMKHGFPRPQKMESSK